MDKIIETAVSEFTPASPGITYELGGKEYPITRFHEIAGINVSLVNIPMTSDYKLQLDCFEDRLKNPEKYEKDYINNIIPLAQCLN